MARVRKNAADAWMPPRVYRGSFIPKTVVLYASVRWMLPSLLYGQHMRR